jgi:hypothetical protein
VSFVVAGRRVVTDAATVINGGNCRHIENGTDVDVTGVETANGVTQAIRLRLRRN